MIYNLDITTPAPSTTPHVTTIPYTGSGGRGQKSFLELIHLSKLISFYFFIFDKKMLFQLCLASKIHSSFMLNLQSIIAVKWYSKVIMLKY